MNILEVAATDPCPSPHAHHSTQWTPSAYHFYHTSFELLLFYVFFTRSTWHWESAFGRVPSNTSGCWTWILIYGLCIHTMCLTSRSSRLYSHRITAVRLLPGIRTQYEFNKPHGHECRHLLKLLLSSLSRARIQNAMFQSSWTFTPALVSGWSEQRNVGSASGDSYRTIAAPRPLLASRVQAYITHIAIAPL